MGPGMSDEMYRKFSKKGKIAYWGMIILVAALIAYAWLQ